MLTKIIVFLLVMAILNVIRVGINLSICFMNNMKYESKWYNTVLFFSSVSYILTIIFCGI